MILWKGKWIFDYDNAQEGTSKKQKFKEEVNASESNSEGLENRHESDENCGTTTKNYPTIKLKNDMENYKWELGTYFTTKCNVKETITTYVVLS